MQPYYYPYIGYFELIKTVDLFVFLNDVQYVKRRWINRNRIRSKNCEWQYITIPVAHMPQRTNICDMKIINSDWHEKQTKTLLHVYGSYIKNHHVFENWMNQKNKTSLEDLLKETIIFITDFLGINTKLVTSKELNINSCGETKLIEICKLFHASTYVNAVGGKNLYSETTFFKNGLKLEFMDESKNANRLSVLDLIFGDKIKSI